MIEEILSRLERIDHKEYSCAFEFADSSTFDEMCRCFEERKILAKEIERLNNIIKETIEELFELKDIIYKVETRETGFDIQKKISSMIVKLGSDKE